VLGLVAHLLGGRLGPDPDLLGLGLGLLAEAVGRAGGGGVQLLGLGARGLELVGDLLLALLQLDGAAGGRLVELRGPRDELLLDLVAVLLGLGAGLLQQPTDSCRVRARTSAASCSARRSSFSARKPKPSSGGGASRPAVERSRRFSSSVASACSVASLRCRSASASWARSVAVSLRCRATYSSTWRRS
jgi:hypothetical protein